MLSNDGGTESAERLASLETKLEQLLDEVRRQGRAAVATSAAVESLSEELRRSSSTRLDDDRNGRLHEPDHQWLQALLPTLDAFDRASVQAAHLAAQIHGYRWLGVVPWVRSFANSVLAFAKGVDLLGRQLDRTLTEIGVDVDRRADCPFDPDRHRILETRLDDRRAPNTVVEVIRPGYRYEGRRIRDTEVVVTTIEDRHS